MKLLRVRVASVAVAAAALFTAPFSAIAQDKSIPTITVVGEGLATAQPDMAVVSLGVVSQAARAADALAQNSKVMNSVAAAVREAGIEARDIETSQISLRPQYSYPQQGAREAPKLVAYEASNNVSVRVRALDRLGGLLDRLVVSGANQIRSVELTIAEPRPLRDSARAAAMNDALRKARILADAAGVQLVRLFSASEELSEPPRPMNMRMSAEAAVRAPVPVETGEQEIRARVTAVFEIAPK